LKDFRIEFLHNQELSLSEQEEICEKPKFTAIS